MATGGYRVATGETVSESISFEGPKRKNVSLILESPDKFQDSFLILDLTIDRLYEIYTYIAVSST